ncbi:hypothetical protein [Cellulomonas massiliensis]|nr:hypothetical protein [Cellulomonas massiliensis]
MPTPAVRRWIYRVATAGLAVAAVYGYVDGEPSAAWLLLAAAVTGMADVNTPGPDGGEE